MNASRRELLSAFLGASVAQTACRRSRPREFPGQFVDGFQNLGHKLRGPAIPLRDEVQRRIDVVVVGAGAAGLSSAWRLVGGGVTNLVVCELDDTVGGTSRWGQNAATRFPWGAHYLPAPTHASGPVFRVLTEMGLVRSVTDAGRPVLAEEVLVHEPEERVFFRGHWSPGLMPPEVMSEPELGEVRRFEQLTDAFSAARDARGTRAFDLPVARSSRDDTWAGLDRMSFGEWLTRENFTGRAVRWLTDYATRDDYGAKPEHVSAWAGLWYFASRHEGDDKSDGYLSWPQGNGALIDHLKAKVGAERLQTNLLVHDISPEADGVHVHALDARTGAPTHVVARQVVVAAPRFATPHVVRPWKRAPPAFVAEFQASPWVVANFELSAPPVSRGAPLSWDNVFFESKSLGYVVATHQAARADAHGPTVLTWYYPVVDEDVRAARERVAGTTREDWVDIAMAELRRAHAGIDELVQRVDVLRWGHAMIRPRPGFMFGPARAQAAEPLEGVVHFAHTDLSGLALFEEANFHGVRAAEEILRAFGHSAESWQ